MDLESRLTRVEERLNAITEDINERKDEERRTRDRLHDLEKLPQITHTLTETLRDLPGQMKSVALEAARETLAKNEESKTNRGLKVADIRLQLGSLLVGAAGVGILIEQLVSHKP